ncbi:MAG: guanylate kinase [Deltaproteobacteria bacterium]|nr:guanylate kinase [Deltaproteobacteria bacterium]
MTGGNLLVISAPSGTGKTTILRPVLRDLANLAFSVSHTTRAPRASEINGRDYHFVSTAEFAGIREAGGFLEWARVHDNFYGTSRQAVDGQLAGGQDIILDIDVQGAMQLKKLANPAAIFIFIAPPSMAELERRLTGRNTETPASLKTRLHNAAMEMSQAAEYDYLIVNDVLDEAIAIFKAIVIAQRAAHRRDLAGHAITNL